MYPKTMIAQKMRFDVENLQYHYQEWSEDMCGLCAIAAVELALRFRRHGYKNVRAVWGYISGELGDHCWVELDGEIWDVTATQFGNIEIVRTTYDNPNWQYKEYDENGDREDDLGEFCCNTYKPSPGTDISKGRGRRKLMSWSYYQRPQSRFTKVLRGK